MHINYNVLINFIFTKRILIRSLLPKPIQLSINASADQQLIYNSDCPLNHKNKDKTNKRIASRPLKKACQCESTTHLTPNTPNT